MRSILRRALCALMCLCLMTPAVSLGEGFTPVLFFDPQKTDAAGLRFDLALDMDPSAFSPELQPTLQGIADLVNIITLQGTLEQAFTGCFDLKADVLLNSSEETRTPVRLFGPFSHWGIQSSLLGDELLMINMLAMMEFSMKVYFHLNIPIQRYTFFLSPYIHQTAFEYMSYALRDTMLLTEGDRVIPRENMLAMAQQIAEISAGDRAFLYWVKGLAMESGYEETILEAFATMPEWFDSFLAEEGVSITTTGATETWRTGEITLFTRTVENDMNAWAVTLPATTNGYVLSIFYNGQGGDHQLQISVTDEYEELLVECLLKAENLPDLSAETPITAPFCVDYTVSGLFLEEDIHLLFQGEGKDGQFSLSMVNPETTQPQLTLSGTLESYTPETLPDFLVEDMEKGVSILSINDTTLTQLLRSVASPMLKGMIPLLVNVPASSLQTILDLLTDSGILGMLASGGASDFGGEGYEEEYSEEFFEDEEFYEDEEYYEDEESWDEEYEDALTGTEE